MKLPGINYNWRVQGLAQRDIYAPQKVAGAEASAANAWAGAAGAGASAAGQTANASRKIGAVYEQIGGYVTKAMMTIQQESAESEAQSAYNSTISQLNELENKLYTKGAVNMEDPIMEGINYDDSYEVIDGQNIVTMNTGFAPTYEVGQKIWTAQSKAIVGNFNNKMSKKAQGIYNNKLTPQLTSKTQNMGRHVIKLGVQDKKGKIDRAINESMRVGDTTGAIRIASDAHDEGYVDRKQMDKYAMEALQQGDLLRFNQELSVTNNEDGLVKLSGMALFSNNYMTTAQKAQMSNHALTKLRQNRTEARQQMTDWRDNNTMGAIIEHYKGNMSTSDLVSDPGKYGRSNFVPLFDRFQKPIQQMSDQTVVRNFGEEIINAPFSGLDPEDTYRELGVQMKDAVIRGDLSVEDYTKATEMMDKQAKAPFKRQPYEEVKKSLFVDMLGTLDATSLEQIQNAGVNIDSMLLKSMGHTGNQAVLAVRAYEDLNAYVRQYGTQADPVSWWKENRDRYKTEDSVGIGAANFQNTYANDAVSLSNGKVDVKSTQDNIVRNYNSGVYGPKGSNEALMEFSKRAAVLKGVDPKDLME